MASKKPMVMERPQRGREMVTREFNMPDQGNQRGATVKLHEGYVGGQKYLVPDADLLAMKELVDYKLGKNPRDRYVRDYEYTNVDDNQKLRRMSEKLKTMDTESDDESTNSVDQKPRTLRFADSVSEQSTKNEIVSEESETETTKSEPEPPAKEEESSEDATSEVSEATVESRKSEATVESRKSEPPAQKSPSISKDSTESQDFSSNKTESFDVEPESPPVVQPPLPTLGKTSNADKLHFLLSGHFRYNQKPIFIFHQYNGMSPFDKVGPDFFSQKYENDMELFIKGKFFNDSILEEINNVPTSLMLKPAILIDNRSKIYEEGFFELVHIGAAGVEMEGKFIKQTDTKKFTPFLSFNMLSPKKTSSSSKDYEPSNIPEQMVYIATPKMKNLFEQKRVKQVDFKVGREKKIREKAPRKNKPSVSEHVEAHKSRPPFRKPKSGGEVNEYEPHLKRNPSKPPQKRSSRSESLREKAAAGDVGSDGALVYNCEVSRRRSSARESKSLLQRLSQMLFT